MASFFRNPQRTYSRKVKVAVPVPQGSVADKSLSVNEGRILQNHLFSSSDNLDSTSSSDTQPKRSTRAVRKNQAHEKENSNSSTFDSDVSRKRKGSSDDSSFDVSACLSRAQQLKSKKESAKLKNQKTRTQPARASQRARTKAPAEKKKSTAKQPVNTSDEFEKPKVKRLKKFNSKTNVSTAAKSKKTVTVPEPEDIPDFKDFEDYELAVETTVSKTPEKKDVNLLSPLRENSWENVGKTDDKIEIDVEERTDLGEAHASRAQLERTIDYYSDHPSATSSTGKDDQRASTGDDRAIAPDSSISQFEPVVRRAQSSPFPGQVSVGDPFVPSSRARSLSVRSTSSSTSGKTAPAPHASSQLIAIASAETASVGEVASAPLTASSTSAASPSMEAKLSPIPPHSPRRRDSTMPATSLTASSSVFVPPESHAESLPNTPPKRIVAFPTPGRNAELPDFSRISFCSPLVAGNLTYEEDEPEVAPLGIKASHLRRLGAMTTSTSTPLQGFKRTSKLALAPGPTAPGSPIMHMSFETKSTSPMFNNVTRRKRFDRNHSTDSVFGESSEMASGHPSGSPAASAAARNRRRRNATSDTTISSLQDSKISMDLFDGSQSAIETSLKAIKEAPAKLSLSHIVEESGESLKVVPDPRVVAGKYDKTDDEDVTRGTISSQDSSRQRAASSYSAATTDHTGVTTNALDEASSTADDGDDDRSRRLDDFLSNSIVGRGSLPNLATAPFETSVSVSRNNHSWPGPRGLFDYLIEILIDGEPHLIGCFAKDDPVDVAREFILENGIDPQQLEVLADFIAKQLKAEEPRVEEEEKMSGVKEEEEESRPIEEEENREEEEEEEGKPENGENPMEEEEEMKNPTVDVEGVVSPTSNVAKSSYKASPVPSVILNLSNEDDSIAEKVLIVSGSTPIGLIDSSASAFFTPPGESSFADDEAMSTTIERDRGQSIVISVSTASSPDVASDDESPNLDPVSPISADGENDECERETEKAALEDSENEQLRFKPRGGGNPSGLNWSATAAFDFGVPVEKSRCGTRLSLDRRHSSRINNHQEAAPTNIESLTSPLSSGPSRRMSRILRNGKTFLDTSPAKSSPLPPTMTLVDAIREGVKEESVKVAPGPDPDPLANMEQSKKSDNDSVTNAKQRKLADSEPAVFKMPQLPAPKPKVSVRNSTRASTSSSRAHVEEERETRRRSIMRNLRRSKKIVFSPEPEQVVSVANDVTSAERSASPILGRKATRRMTMAPMTNEAHSAMEKKRRATMMTPIQKLAQWRRGSMGVTPTSVESAKTMPSVMATPTGETTAANEGPTSKAARNLNENFQAVRAPPETVSETTTTATLAFPLAVETCHEKPSTTTTTTTNSPVVVLKRLSSEEIAAAISESTAVPPPSTPAWEKSRRLLTSPVVMLTPLVRHLRPAIADLSLSSPREGDLSLLPHEASFQLNETMDADDARSRVLEVCCQSTELAFYDVYPKTQMAAMKKIGEGTYGEVYLSYDELSQKPVALKVIPIEGDDLVNDERQKTYAEMLSEAVITKEMSELSSSSSTTENQTSGFICVNRICAFRGTYPPELLKKWDEWAKKNKSWNDRPDFYAEDQLFLVFEFSEGGSDLEKFRFTCPRDVMNVFRQTMLALAVGEAELEFEHRDLHWGNVLIKKLDAPETIANVLNGERLEMTTNVRVSIIDFTLSRLKRGGLTQFTDLADDPDIFKGVGEEAGEKDGDYQFDCYRFMRDETRNEWKPHAPRTNIIWLHYLAKKLIGKMKTMTKKQRGTSNWKSVSNKLSSLESELLKCSTVSHALSLVET